MDSAFSGGSKDKQFVSHFTELACPAATGDTVTSSRKKRLGEQAGSIKIKSHGVQGHANLTQISF